MLHLSRDLIFVWGILIELYWFLIDLVKKYTKVFELLKGKYVEFLISIQKN